MSDTEKKEEKESGISLGTLITIGAVLMIVVGMGIYQYMSAPYRVADELREHLDNKGNVSDEYKQGWLDCVAYYLKKQTEATNMTSSASIN